MSDEPVNLTCLLDPDKGKDNTAQEDEDGSDTECGFGSCRPQKLQVFANVNAFTGFYGIAGFLSTTLVAYVNSQVTTLERQFGLSSAETGVVVASNDIGYLVVALFVGYLAHRVHIPRFLSISIAVFGISGIICSLPHFLFGPGQLSSGTDEGEDDIFNSTLKPQNDHLCSLANDSSMNFCSEIDTKERVLPTRQRQHTTAALVIIIIGMILQGMAKAPGYPFSVTYLDETKEKVKTGFYMGIVTSLKIFGPAVAFGLGGYFSKIYVTLGDTDLYPRHPRWIGAWWLGYVVFGTAAIFVSIPVFFLPRRQKAAGKKVKIQSTGMKKGNKSFLLRIQFEIKTYMKLMVSLLSNPVNLCIVLASISILFSVGGLHSFMPKYLENQFGIPAWKANLLIAGLSISNGTIGTYLGGWITKKFKMGPMAAIKFVIVCMFIKLGVTSLGFVFGCPQPTIYGQPGTPMLVTSSVNFECNNTNCHCNNAEYFPVCGSDNNNYFSPCHAGCLNKEDSVYQNCSCIPDGGTATAGMCDYQCGFLYPYAACLVVGAFLSTIIIMPIIITKIRCVTEEEKPMALAFSSWTTSLFGWLLGPVVYGRVIDSTCILWNISCGERGSCAIYDIGDFRVKVHGFDLAARGAATMFFCFAMVIAMKTNGFAKNKKNKTKEESVPI